MSSSPTPGYRDAETDADSRHPVVVIWKPGTWILVLAVLYTLHFARDILIPIAMAFLFNLLLAPLVRLLRRRLGIPQSISAILIVGLLMFGIVGAFYALSAPAADWLEKLPKALLKIERQARLLDPSSGDVKDVAKRIRELGSDAAGPEKPVPVVLEGPSLMQTALGQTAIVSMGVLITVVLLIFLLASGDTLLRQAIKVMPTLSGKKRLVDIVRESEEEISHFLLTISLINAGLGCAIGFAFWLLGVPNPVLWGAMAAILNFIPFIGGLVGASIAAIVALTTFETTLAILAPPLTYAILNGIEGQLVTPSLLARRFTLNPVTVFLSLILWSWLWGIMGALLAVPLLAAFHIVSSHVEELKPWDTFLGERATDAES